MINQSPSHLINVAQCAKDHDMFESWERELLEQTAIMLWNRQAISSDQEEQVVRIVTEASRFNLPIHNEEVDALSVASLAAFDIPANLRSHILESDDSCTVGLLRRTGFRFAAGSQLSRLLRTDQHRRELRNGLSTFENVMMSWTRGIRRDVRAKWILPENYLSSDLSLRCIQREDEMEDLIASTPMHPCCVRLAPAARWLPFLSIELIREIRRSSSDDYHLIKEMLLTVSAKYLAGNTSGPWEKAFFDELAVMPLYWLYQFKPTHRTRTLIHQLVRSYCTNIGHLVPFQRDVFTAIRGTAPEDWYSLMLLLSPQS